MYPELPEVQHVLPGGIPRARPDLDPIGKLGELRSTSTRGSQRRRTSQGHLGESSSIDIQLHVLLRFSGNAHAEPAPYRRSSDPLPGVRHRHVPSSEMPCNTPLVFLLLLFFFC